MIATVVNGRAVGVAAAVPAQAVAAVSAATAILVILISVILPFC